MAGNKAKKVLETIEGLKEYWPDFDLTVDEIVNPTINSVQKFYGRFLYDLGINDSVIRFLIDNSNRNNCNDYKDFEYVYALYVCSNQIGQLLISNQQMNISLQDFINPTAERTMFQVRCFVNYVYYDNIISQTTVLPLREKVIEEIESLSEIRNQVNNMDEILTTILCTKTKNIDIIKELDREKEELLSSFDKPILKSKELDQKIQDLKAELKVCEQENAKLVDNWEKTLEKQKELESLVVHDNENIVKEYKNIENEIYEEEILSQEYIQNLEKKLKTETYALKNCEIFMNFIESLNLVNKVEQFNLISDCENNKKKYSQEWNAILKSENKIQNEIQRLNQEYSELEEKQAAINLKSKTRLNLLETEYNELKKEHDEIKQQLEKAKKYEEVLNNKLNIVTDMCTGISELSKKQDNFYSKQYASVLKAKCHLDTKTMNAIKIINEKISN